MRLLIVRHADPDYSIDSLTETGWKEAKLLVPRLSKLDVKAFYCSPLGRAKDTASFTLKAMGREAEIKPWLRELTASNRNPSGSRCFWDWMPDIWTREPRHYDRERWLEHPYFQEEDLSSEIAKIHAGLDEMLASHGYVREGNCYRAVSPNEDTIVLFCHFGLECVLLGHLLGISPMVLWHGTCAAPTSITTVITEERQEGIASFRMSAFGDISHLYAAGEEPSFSARYCEVFTNKDQRH